jgi:proteasome accessory factor C
MGDVHERLRRLLFLVPYVARHPGIPVEALARALGVSKEALLEELDLLTLVGRPPFQPDDFIDLHVDEKERVFVDLDQRFSKPPRLTAPEAAALFAAAALLEPAPGDPLANALSKLEAVLPAPARERYREISRAVDASAAAPRELAPLTQAIAQRREVRFDYFSANRGASEPRTVRPYELFAHRGAWYLDAFCLTRNDARLFRVDRMRGLEVGEGTFEAQPTRRAHVPNPAERGGAPDVRVRFSPAAAPYVTERFGAQARPLEGGAVEVRVAGDSERWLTQWVLSFGGEAEVLGPDWARRAVARAAQASIQS